MNINGNVWKYYYNDKCFHTVYFALLTAYLFTNWGWLTCVVWTVWTKLLTEYRANSCQSTCANWATNNISHNRAISSTHTLRIYRLKYNEVTTLSINNNVLNKSILRNGSRIYGGVLIIYVIFLAARLLMIFNVLHNNNPNKFSKIIWIYVELTCLFKIINSMFYNPEFFFSRSW